MNKEMEFVAVDVLLVILRKRLPHKHLNYSMHAASECHRTVNLNCLNNARIDPNSIRHMERHLSGTPIVLATF